MSQFGRRGEALFDRRRLLCGLATGAAATLLGGRASQAGSVPTRQALNEQNPHFNVIPGGDSPAPPIDPMSASEPLLSLATLQATERAVGQYEAIVGRGGWPRIAPGDTPQLGMRHPNVAALRQRLLDGGDLVGGSEGSDVYDANVEAAIRRFQTRHGFAADGQVRESALSALNVSAQVRLAQLRTNLSRLRAFGGLTAPRMVVCNIAAAQVEAVESDAVVARYTAVVGKPDRPSPELQSKIFQVNFNPYWTVPTSIVKHDLMPKMMVEPDYLSKNHIRVLDGRGREVIAQHIDWASERPLGYRLRQDPGDFNSLGAIRINFRNPHQVYMHDTPLKNLFDENFRFDSSGCVRVQNIRALAEWLLSPVPGWSPSGIDQVIKAGERKDARVAPAVPLCWTYVTAWATADGVVQFRDDIYSRDGVGAYATRT